MDNIFLISGLACLIAAVVGGGLKAFGIEVPVLASRGRQLALGVLGLIFLAIGAGGFPTSSKNPPPDVRTSGKTRPTSADSKQRQSTPTGPISVNVNSDPRVVSPGGSTEITVFATASDGSVVPNAHVIVSAGGGAFKETGATQVVGSTNEKGLFHTTWRTYEPSAYTGEMSYAIGVEVKKEGFVEGKGEIEVFVRK
jgi:hypothetical protein